MFNRRRNMPIAVAPRRADLHRVRQRYYDMVLTASPEATDHRHPGVEKVIRAPKDDHRSAGNTF